MTSQNINRPTAPHPAGSSRQQGNTKGRSQKNREPEIVLSPAKGAGRPINNAPRQLSITEVSP